MAESANVNVCCVYEGQLTTPHFANFLPLNPLFLTKYLKTQFLKGNLCSLKYFLHYSCVFKHPVVIVEENVYFGRI